MLYYILDVYFVGYPKSKLKICRVQIVKKNTHIYDEFTQHYLLEAKLSHYVLHCHPFEKMLMLVCFLINNVHLICITSESNFNLGRSC